MKQAILFLLIGTVACTTESPLAIDDTTYPNTVTVTLQCGTADTLRFEGGLQLVVYAGSFDCGEGNTVELAITPAITPRDMALVGATTIDKDGNWLESGGMFQVQTRSGHSISATAPITAVVPTAMLRGGMTVFRGDGGPDRWVDTGEPVVNVDASLPIIDGAAFFNKHCTACHSRDLTTKATGPALGGVHHYRDTSWFRKWVSNSQAMIASGDTIAVMLWNEWKPTVMSSFGTTFDFPVVNAFTGDAIIIEQAAIDDTLSTAEIQAIYEWLRWESERRGIQKEDVYHPVKADFAARQRVWEASRRMRDSLQRIAQARQDSIWAALKTVDTLSGGTAYSMNLTSGTQSEKDLNEMGTYQMAVPTSGWYNVDRLAKISTWKKLPKPTLQIEGMTGSDMSINLYFPRRNIAVVYKWNVATQQYEVTNNFTSNEMISLPKEEAIVIGYAYDHANLRITHYTFHKVTLNEVDNHLVATLRVIE